MGGRSAASGVETFGKKWGVRLTLKQYKEAVSDEANFILRDLEQDEAIQIIVKRSFKNGVPVVQLSDDGIEKTIQLNQGQVTINKLTNVITAMNGVVAEAQKEKKSSQNWSGYDVARAKAQAYQQAVTVLKDAIKKLKARV